MIAALPGNAATAAVEAPPAAPRPGLRRGALVFAGGQVLAMLLGFASGMLLVRIASQESVASYLLFLRGVTAVALVLQLGLVPVVIRFAPLSRGTGGEREMPLLRRRVLGLQIAAWALLGPVVVAAWAPAVTLLGAPELAAAGGLVALAAVALSFNGVADAYVRSARRYGTSSLLSSLLVRALLVASFLALLLLGVSTTSWRTLGGLFVAATLAVAALFVVALARVRRLDGAGAFPARPAPAAPAILATAGVMGLHGGVVAVMLSLDLWVLSWARPHAEVAVYGVMLSLLQLMAVLPAVANQVIPQELARLHADGRRRELETLLRRAATAVAMVSAAALLGLALAGRPLLRLGFGDAYVLGWVPLLVLAGGRFFDATAGSVGYLLQMTGNHRVLLAVTAAAAACNVVVAVALAPRLGGLGVAIATSGSLVGLNLVLLRVARRRLGVTSFAFVRPREWGEVARQLAGRARP